MLHLNLNKCKIGNLLKKSVNILIMLKYIVYIN